MLLAVTVLLCAVVIWRMVWPLKVRWYVKVLLALPLAVGAFKFQCFRVNVDQTQLRTVQRRFQQQVTAEPWSPEDTAATDNNYFHF